MTQQTQQGEIILYQPDETVRLEVRLEDDTVWLTQAQMAELFQTTKNNITLHIGNVYKEEELSPHSTSKESLLVQIEGNRHNTQYTPITVKHFNRAHDRFLLVDNEVYHIGASLKDLGKKWFAFTLMHDLTAAELTQKIEN